MLRPALAVLPLLLLAQPLAAAPAGDGARAVNTIAASVAFKQAEAKLAADFDLFIEQLITITEIPAPPFKEEARGKAYADMLRAAGLKDVTIDEVGNVLALRPGTDPKAKAVVLSAHLDTVFPEDTVIKVRREGDKLHAPGIGDDSRGLANMLAYVRALDAAKIRTKAPILFVATVGEEGPGDLAESGICSPKARGKTVSALSFRLTAAIRRGLSMAGSAPNATASPIKAPAATALARSVL